MLNAKRDLDAARRFFRTALKDEPLLAPITIGNRRRGIVTLPCEECERTTPQRFSSGRDDLVPRTHRRGA
jgi:hypothetical protein